jgi:hypothetical protein
MSSRNNRQRTRSKDWGRDESSSSSSSEEDHDEGPQETIAPSKAVRPRPDDDGQQEKIAPIKARPDDERQHEPGKAAEPARRAHEEDRHPRVHFQPEKAYEKRLDDLERYCKSKFHEWSAELTRYYDHTNQRVTKFQNEAKAEHDKLKACLEEVRKMSEGTTFKHERKLEELIHQFQAKADQQRKDSERKIEELIHQFQAKADQELKDSERKGADLESIASKISEAVSQEVFSSRASSPETDEEPVVRRSARSKSPARTKAPAAKSSRRSKSPASTKAPAAKSPRRSKSPGGKKSRSKGRSKGRSKSPAKGQDEAPPNTARHVAEVEREVCEWGSESGEEGPQADGFQQMLHWIIIHLQSKTLQTHTELNDLVQPLDEVVRLDFPCEEQMPTVMDRQAHILKLITCLFQTVCVISMEEGISPEDVYSNQDLLLLAVHRVHAMPQS